MKLSRLKIVKIYKALEALVKDGSIKPLAFKYISKKIREMLKAEVEAVTEVEPKKRAEYNNRVNQILIDNAERHEDGTPKTINNTNLIRDLIIPDENRQKIASAVSAINGEVNFEEMIKEEQEFDKFMKDEIEIDVPKISKKDLWESIDEEALEVLFDIIEE